MKSVPVPRRDVTRAKALLKEAGVPNLSFTLNLPSGSENAQVAQVIQAMLQEAGIDMKLRTVEFATSLQMASKGDFEAYLIPGRAGSTRTATSGPSAPARRPRTTPATATPRWTSG